MDKIDSLATDLRLIVSHVAVAADFDDVWPSPLRDIVRVDLLSAVPFHGGAGIYMRFRSDEVAECHRTESVFLASGLGIRCFMAAAHVGDWSDVPTPVRRQTTF